MTAGLAAFSALVRPGREGRRFDPLPMARLGVSEPVMPRRFGSLGGSARREEINGQRKDLEHRAVITLELNRREMA